MEIIGEFGVTSVEFVSLATAGQGELVTAFSWELTAYRKQKNQEDVRSLAR